MKKIFGLVFVCFFLISCGSSNHHSDVNAVTYNSTNLNSEADVISFVFEAQGSDGCYSPAEAISSLLKIRNYIADDCYKGAMDANVDVPRGLCPSDAKFYKDITIDIKAGAELNTHKVRNEKEAQDVFESLKEKNLSLSLVEQTLDMGGPQETFEIEPMQEKGPTQEQGPTKEFGPTNEMGEKRQKGEFREQQGMGGTKEMKTESTFDFKISFEVEIKFGQSSTWVAVGKTQFYEDISGIIKAGQCSN